MSTVETSHTSVFIYNCRILRYTLVRFMYVDDSILAMENALTAATMRVESKQSVSEIAYRQNESVCLQ
jgi:hypothetical protein